MILETVAPSLLFCAMQSVIWIGKYVPWLKMRGSRNRDRERKLCKGKRKESATADNLSFCIGPNSKPVMSVSLIR